MPSGVREIILVGVVAVAIGAAVARWWLLPLPPIAAVIWVVVAALTGGADSDGMPYWQLAAYVGTMLAGEAMLALAVGVVWGRWAREKAVVHRRGAT
jgi:hypothetical protein